MKQKGSKRAKFTREGITQSGFVEVSPGVFAKPDPQAPASLRDPEPPPAGVERDPPKRAARKAGTKSRGKASNPTGVRFQLVVISYRPRAIDPSNCCAKFIEDFLQEIGLLPDDSVFYVEAPVIKQVLVPEKEQKTEVFLYQIDEEQTQDREEAADP